MKEGWEYKKLNEICSSIEDGDWIESKDQSQAGIRLIQTGNIGNGIYKDKQNSAKYISEETFKKLHCTEIFEGDILVSRLPDPVGRACILPNLGCRCITAVDCSILKIKKDLVYNEWITYYMQSGAYFTKIKNECTGSTRQRITRKKLAEILIPVPSLSEQQSIVDYLDTAFAKIDAMKTNAEKALDEAKALFQASLKEMLEPKEGWVKKRLGEVCELSQGLAINSKTRYLLKETGQLPLLRIKDMKDGTREVFVDEKNCPQNCIANEDDIIYTRTGTLGLVFTGMKGVLHNNCFKIAFNKSILDKSFFMYYLSHEAFKSNIIKLASRAAQPDITHKLFKTQEIVFPPISDQQSIATTLDSLKSKVDHLQENYNKISQECDTLKQAMLKQVFE